MALGLALALASTTTTAARVAVAQAVPPAPPPAPAAEPPAPSTSAPAAAPAPAPEVVAPAAPRPNLGGTAVAGGALTADLVGRRAAETSYSARAAQEAVRSAAVKVDQAWSNYLPRLSGKFSYTRLSEFTPPSATGGGSIVGTPQPAGTPNPTPTVAVGFTFPLVLNQWALEAQLVVPISDYFLRINQGYAAATNSQDAARLDVVTARAKSAAEGRVAYYNWLRARGAVVVATQSLEAVKVHLADAKNLLAVGSASRADVLRAETAVAGAELAVERTKNLAALTEKQVSLAIHAKEDEALVPGEGIDGEVAPFVGSLPQLIAEAKAGRYEIKSIDASASAARKQAEAYRGGAYPSLAAFGSALYANPNQRRFPLSNEWFGTWALGAQVTWSPNDAYGSLAGAKDVEANVARVEAQREAVRDGVELEVTQAFQAVREADFAAVSSKRQLASAEEAHRVARELFVNGRATSTTLTDAEADLTRARLEQLNARIEARAARVRLEHALGRDARGYDR